MLYIIVLVSAIYQLESAMCPHKSPYLLNLPSPSQASHPSRLSQYVLDKCIISCIHHSNVMQCRSVALNPLYSTYSPIPPSWTSGNHWFLFFSFSFLLSTDLCFLQCHVLGIIVYSLFIFLYQQYTFTFPPYFLMTW